MSTSILGKVIAARVASHAQMVLSGAGRFRSIRRGCLRGIQAYVGLGETNSPCFLVPLLAALIASAVDCDATFPVVEFFSPMCWVLRRPRRVDC